MQKLNLCSKESDIDYSIFKFPDGEVQIKLGEINRKEPVEVHCRITNAEELFILMQVADVLNRHEVEWNLFIYYLMGMRMDRVMDFNRPFTLKVVATIIKNLGALEVGILDPHSNRSLRLSNSEYMCIEDANSLYHDLDPSLYSVHRNYQVIYPDEGAAERYDQRNYLDTVTAKKIRNIETGKIESIEITNPELFKDNTKPIMVVDDLCDAGGTFVELANEIRKYTNKELNIFVTHMVNEKGIKNLSENYNHVYFTNSYKDWSISYINPVNNKIDNNLPENVTQINVI